MAPLSREGAMIETATPSRSSPPPAPPSSLETDLLVDGGGMAAMLSPDES